jgi:hypothetical protein
LKTGLMTCSKVTGILVLEVRFEMMVCEGNMIVWNRSKERILCHWNLPPI